MRLFVVGGTGLLGGKVIDNLLKKGDEVYALVRSPEAEAAFKKKGVKTFMGDLKEPDTLMKALNHSYDGLVTTAYGYSKRQKGDTLHSVDNIGNRNLIHAALKNNVGRFVFTSILTAEKAIHVPHFYQKALTENELEKSGINWVSLRPGGFLDTLLGLNISGIKKGRFMVPTNHQALASTILSDDLAVYLSEAVRMPGISGKRIDIGMKSPTNIIEIASLLSKELGRKIVPSAPPTFVMLMLKIISKHFNGSMYDNLKAMEYIATGQYVADISLQESLFGSAPTIDDSIHRWLNDNAARIKS